MGEKLGEKVENKHYQFSLFALFEKTTVNFECYKLFNLFNTPQSHMILANPLQVTFLSNGES